MERADTAKCASNMRQIGVGMFSFAAENNGTLPPVRAENPMMVWFEAIAPYIESYPANSYPPFFEPKNVNSLICPVWRKHAAAQNWHPSNWNRLGYAMSYVMVGSPHVGGPKWARTDYAVRLAELPAPSQTIMVAEDQSWNWGLHSVNYNNHPYWFNKLRGARHGKNGSNFLFADGRVQQLNMSNVLPYLAK